MHLWPLLLALSSTISLDGTWYGYCITEIANQQVCSDVVENTGNFAAFCNAFVREHDGVSWATRFSTDPEKLSESQDSYCDVVLLEDEEGGY